jgi:hypothetical protein
MSFFCALVYNNERREGISTTPGLAVCSPSILSALHGTSSFIGFPMQSKRWSLLMAAELVRTLKYETISAPSHLSLNTPPSLPYDTYHLTNLQ